MLLFCLLVFFSLLSGTSLKAEAADLVWHAKNRGAISSIEDGSIAVEIASGSHIYLGVLSGKNAELFVLSTSSKPTFSDVLSTFYTSDGKRRPEIHTLPNRVTFALRCYGDGVGSFHLYEVSDSGKGQMTVIDSISTANADNAGYVYSSGVFCSVANAPSGIKFSSLSSPTGNIIQCSFLHGFWNVVPLSTGPSEFETKNMSFWDTVKTRFQQAVEGITGVTSAVNSKFTEIKTSLTTWFKGIGDDITSGWNTFTAKTKEFKDAVGNWFSGIGDDISSGWQSFKDKIKEFKDAVGDWFTSLKDSISTKFEEAGDKIKSFFIPQEDYFQLKANALKAQVTDHMGGFAEGAQALQDVMTQLKNYNPSGRSITFPGISVPWHGKSYQLMAAQTYSFSFLSDKPFSTIYGFYTSFVYFAVALALFHLCFKKFKKIMSDGTAGGADE